MQTKSRNNAKGNPLNDGHQTNEHPSKDIKGVLGSKLAGRRIVICVTASVACYKAIDLIRLLIRNGAEVHVVSSKAVEKFIHKDYFLWASGNPVTSALSGDLEHVRLANYNSSDLVIVYPCTANTISKFASGIDDTTVTSVLSIALGSKIPIIISPAMHEAMYYNPIITSNIQKLEQLGVIFTNPIMKEDKAKVSSVEDVFVFVIKLISNQNGTSDQNKTTISGIDEADQFFRQDVNKLLVDLNINQVKSFFKDKKILISLGSTLEYIDPIRVISNNSSGKMGLSLIRAATNFGFDITVLKGITQMDERIFQHQRQFSLRIIEAKTTDEMANALRHELFSLNYDIVILSAAVSDFRPQIFSESKISTDNLNLHLDLMPTVKIVDMVKQIQDKIFLVAFKAEYAINDHLLIEKAYKKLAKCNADLIVANDVGPKQNVIGSDTNKVVIVDKNKNFYDFPLQKKEIVAENILKMVYLQLVK